MSRAIGALVLGLLSVIVYAVMWGLSMWSTVLGGAKWSKVIEQSNARTPYVLMPASGFWVAHGFITAAFDLGAGRHSPVTQAD